MRIHLVWVFVVAIFACLLGVAIGNLNQRIKQTKNLSLNLSLAGQTLKDLSVALENQNARQGRYPESLSGLVVENKGGDFSPEVLRNITYFRIQNGYVAFVGIPKVAYVCTGAGVAFK